jgi:tripartite-type tricarboxylate transporter receptor subunit TctC
MRIVTLALTILWALTAWAPQASHAEEAYPSKPIKMIVPFPAGGAADVLVRILTQAMSQDLGQPFVVVNHPGAGGSLAFEQVARSAPDGYTLTWTSVGFPVMAATLHDLSFNPATDFTHIAEVASNPFILVVNPKVPAKSVAELIALAKAKPGSINLAHNGSGTLTKLAISLLRLQTGINVVDVGYRGDNFSIADVIAGRVQGMFSNSPVALPHMAAGQLRGLAVTSAKRSPAAPDLPTMIEAGVPDFDVVVWHGISGPAGMPRPVVDRINAAVNKALADPDVVAREKKLGVEPIGGTPEQYQNLVKQQLVFWDSIAKRAQAAGK